MQKQNATLDFLRPSGELWNGHPNGIITIFGLRGRHSIYIINTYICCEIVLIYNSAK